MKRLAICYIIVTVAFGVNVVLSSTSTKWYNFKLKYGKRYATHQEEQYRFSVFRKNLQKIAKRNRQYELGLSGHKLGVNKFADLDRFDFGPKTDTAYTQIANNTTHSIFKIPSLAEIPTEIDWRKLGAVTPVQDQGSCSSCWSFAITGALEAQYFLKHNRLVPLSKQNLVDCGKLYARGLNGCNGAGVPVLSYYYIRDYGIESEADYPYEAVERDCRADASKALTRVSDYVMIPANDEEAMKAAVGLVGPISVTIDMRDLYLYQGGIFESDDCLKEVGSGDHAMLIVGYGSDNGVDYWLVKNSFGVDFGEEGYVRMRRGINQCGIATYANYPVL
ncbi:procathepsin L-like [Cylas formicarius]|uniref:procathepsin L-like n=1 Tax=Cylas formicarius TaxID=197179 RepID=UPI002958BF6E|nr:procathepsin L-like [Cylas formicarius]